MGYGDLAMLARFSFTWQLIARSGYSNIFKIIHLTKITCVIHTTVVTIARVTMKIIMIICLI